MNMKETGEFIKKKRKEKGFTQKELAKQLSITDRAISKWERGMSFPDVSLLQELSMILEVTVLELLKGSEIDSTHSFSDQDVISSMKLSQECLLNKIKLITNFLSILVVVIFVLYVSVTSFMSIYLEAKKYDMRFYDYGGVSYPGGKYIRSEPYYDKKISSVYLQKTETILKSQGKYTDEEYQKIKSYTKIMRERILEQENEKYYQITDYRYTDILNFYISHQNIITIEINTEDLYDILIKYDQNLVNHYVRYKEIKEMVLHDWTQILTFLDQPFYIGKYYTYDYPNVYGIMQSIYEKEIMLCDDIMEVGELA